MCVSGDANSGQQGGFGTVEQARVITGGSVFPPVLLCEGSGILSSRQQGGWKRDPKSAQHLLSLPCLCSQFPFEGLGGIEDCKPQGDQIPVEET